MLKVPHYAYPLIFTFHFGVQWSSLLWSIIQKLCTSPENIFSPLFMVLHKKLQLVLDSLVLNKLYQVMPAFLTVMNA